MKTSNPYLKKNNYSYLFEFNIYFLLLISNFLAYSVYAVLSKYNILLIEILININFIIFFYLYKKNLSDKISLKISFNNREIIFFIGLLLILFFLIFSELKVPLFIDELAFTRRGTRTALFSSFFFLHILDIDYLKTIPLKIVIQFLNLLQIFFIVLIFYFLKKKPNVLNLIFILSVTFILRYLLKDGVHHPPLNHLFSTIFISFFGLSHIVIRLSYFLPFLIFLFVLYKLVRESFDEKVSMIFILTLSTFPLLFIASVFPDHSIWSCFVFTYLLFYIVIKKNIDYRFCILIISLGILFRISIFSSFILIGLCFIGDVLHKKFLLIDKIIYLIKTQKIPLIILIFLPLFFVSIVGTPAFEGVDNVNSFSYFLEAIKSKIIIYSFIKQIPVWYYIFFGFIFFLRRKIAILVFFIFNLIIYFSVNPGLWGLAKYVLEYGIPFFLLGHFIFTKLLMDKKKIFLVYIINIAIVILNISDVHKFPKSNLSADEIFETGFFKPNRNKEKNTKYILKIPYSYDKAFNYIAEKKSKKNTLFLGTTYGFLPQILENYSYNELVEVIDIKANFDKIRQADYSISEKITKINETNKLKKIIREYFNFMKKVNIVKNKAKTSKVSEEEIEYFSHLKEIKNLKYLLLANYGNREKIKNILLSNNWIIEKEFKENNYRSTLILFKNIN